MAKAASRALIELCGKLRDWRAREGGGRGKRVPRELWQQAVRVTQTDGLHATARATRLNYDRLKKRVGSEDKSVRAPSALTNGPFAGGRARPAHASTVPSKSFVALQVAPSSSIHPTTIELVGRHGDRMRIEVHGEVDLCRLVQAFGDTQP